MHWIKINGVAYQKDRLHVWKIRRPFVDHVPETDSKFISRDNTQAYPMQST